MFILHPVGKSSAIDVKSQYSESMINQELKLIVPHVHVANKSVNEHHEFTGLGSCQFVSYFSMRELCILPMLPHLFQNCHASNLPKQKIVGELNYFAHEMSTIAENIDSIRNEIPDEVTLVVVSKTQPNENLLAVYEAGERVFGENRVQEMVQKYEALPKDIEWHMIGHLQKNKVKYIAPFVSCIHSVDDMDLLPVIDRQAEKYGRTIRVLIQFHIAKEDTKFGSTLQEALDFLAKNDLSKFKNLVVAGVMGMATFTENKDQIRNEFRSLKGIFDTLKTTHFSLSSDFKEISMGMSGDFKLAIEEGSTMIRVGSSIFGNRV